LIYLKLLLYAEGDGDTRESRVQIFSQIKNVPLLVAADGAEAISLLAPEIDMVLADYRMPFHTGDEVLAEAMKKAPNAKRVILSAYAKRGLDTTWAHEVLQKPDGSIAAIELIRKPD
jgi:CheY-like chemotaxis protein